MINQIPRGNYNRIGINYCAIAYTPTVGCLQLEIFVDTEKYEKLSLI